MTTVEPNGEGGPSTLQDYLQILRRRKWLVLQAVILVPLAAVLWGHRGTTVYSASAGVLIDTQNLAANVEGVSDPSQMNPARVVQTQIPIARIPVVARRTIEAAGLSDWSPSDLLGRSSVSSSSDNSDILTFSVTDPQRALAVRLATEYARQFIRYRLELDTAAIVEARRAVGLRIEALAAAGQAHSALYANLLETEQKLSTLETLQTSRATLVRPATGAAEIGPNPVKDAIFGLAIGLVLGLGLAWARESTDTRVRSADIVAYEVGLPLLGRLARPPSQIRRRRELVSLVEPHGPHAEAFRMLVPRIELKIPESQPCVIVVTSAVEREGKSTTAANLAVAFARTGKRVVLVDFDPYSPGLDAFFHRSSDPGRRSSSPGLTDVLLRRVSLESALAEVDVGLGHGWAGPTNGDERSAVAGEKLKAAAAAFGERLPSSARTDSTSLRGRLEILLSGATPPDPGLLNSSAFATILEQLRVRADLVLLDAPPALRTADAFVAGFHGDAVLVVVRLNFVRHAMLADLARLLASYPAMKLGFVATGANAETGYRYIANPYFRRYSRESVDVHTDS